MEPADGLDRARHDWELDLVPREHPPDDLRVDRLGLLAQPDRLVEVARPLRRAHPHHRLLCLGRVPAAPLGRSTPPAPRPRGARCRRARRPCRRPRPRSASRDASRDRRLAAWRRPPTDARPRRLRPHAGALPVVAPVCRDCVWWRSRGNRTASKQRWIERAEEDWGEWGSIYLDDHGRLLGSLQYGPAHLFPRAADLPAGPASDDAALVTCVYLLAGAAGWVEKSLLLAAIGSRATEGSTALEAFAYRYPERETQEERFLVHRTVFPRDFLDEFGFVTLRSQGRVELCRLELGGLSRSRRGGGRRCCASSRTRSRRRRSRSPVRSSLADGANAASRARSMRPPSSHRATSAATSTSSRSSTRTRVDMRDARLARRAEEPASPRIARTRAGPCARLTASSSAQSSMPSRICFSRALGIGPMGPGTRARTRHAARRGRAGYPGRSSSRLVRRGGLRALERVPEEEHAGI